MTLVKFANGHRTNGFNPLLTDVFNSVLNDNFLGGSAKTPAVNIAESENQYHIELAVPGLSKEDFKISVEKNILSVSAEKKADKTEVSGTDKKYAKKEFSYTSFTRTFTLPETVDYANIEADYTNGILTLNIAKKEEAKIQTREIVVK